MNAINDATNNAMLHPAIAGSWQFDKFLDNKIPDLSGNNHPLIVTGTPRIVHDSQIKNAISFDKNNQSLFTNTTVLRTDESFSIAAWVLLDSAALNGKLSMKVGENAFTAVSQDTPTHSTFYLGLRRFINNYSDGSSSFEINWSFILAPENMKNAGIHARSKALINDSILDKWMLLVGVCDIPNRAIHIYLPTINDKNTAYMPNDWSCWHANGALRIGQGRWLENNVDQWPGRMGPIRAYAGVLTEEDAMNILAEDMKNH